MRFHVDRSQFKPCRSSLSVGIGLARLDERFQVRYSCFLPHLTISEAVREPEENAQIIATLRPSVISQNVLFDRISWIIPDKEFVFREYISFGLNL